MIWVSLVFILFFFVTGLILMNFPGSLPRFIAIICMVAELPLIAAKQVVWTEGPLAIQLIALPFSVLPFLVTFFISMVYAATLNWFETPGVERDYRGRKRKK